LEGISSLPEVILTFKESAPWIKIAGNLIQDKVSPIRTLTAYRGAEVKLRYFLSSALDGDRTLVPIDMAILYVKFISKFITTRQLEKLTILVV
jgi:hypothetical protein